MNTTTVTLLFAALPYAALAWACAALVDGMRFWQAMVGLLLIRLCFAIIETLGGVLSWRLHGRNVMIGKTLELLRSNAFPKRKYTEDDFLTYLGRIEDGDEYTASMKSLAKEVRFVLSTQESSPSLAAE